MNLKNFQQTVEPQIANRGYHYYEDGYIEEIEQVEKGEFVATVQGTEEYSITVKIDEDLNVLSHSCDCPYDWGTVCKHEVAVMYYLRKNKLYNQPVGEGPLSKIKQDLQGLSKKELLEILVDLSQKSKLVKEYLSWELGHETYHDSPESY